MHKRRKAMAEINVVPYIDVMLVLLVIFMTTTPLLTQGVKVDLPNAHAKTVPTKEIEPIIVTVNKQGQYFLNIAPNPRSALNASTLSQHVAHALERAKSHHQKRLVLIKGDRSANYETVVRAMALLQKAGAPSVGLLTSDVKTG